MIDYTNQLLEILNAPKLELSSLRPSEWAEERIIMPKPFPGPLRYEKTPYTREIIDCFAQDHPAREIALMGAAQFGKTASVIIPAIGYIMENDPGNIIMTVGHEDLIEEAMNKLDFMLDSTGLRQIIKPSAKRLKAQKSGDTNTKKEFPNGYIKLSAASNPKIWRQVDYKFGLIDDFEAVKGRSKEAGSIRSLILKRFTAYSTTKKILYVSSPELKKNSNILEVYQLGDQRKFMVPCPCCGVPIELIWETIGRNGEPAGITWALNEEGGLIPDSVGYVCQECGDFFTDRNKADFINKGFWQPTAKPSKPDFYSYHMSSLYSPPGMTGWTEYVYEWLECHPIGQPRIESKYQSFLNLNLGLPYEETGEAPKANELQKNIRGYEIEMIPEKLSMSDGNGKIVLLTCASDLNGVVEDARLDYEIVAWAESGASYSIKHGSIGTFIPREGKIKADREKWTYEHHRNKSVWPEFSNILDKIYETDTGRRMKILMAGVDSGHYTNYAYDFVDKMNRPTFVALKGDKENKFRRFGIDTPSFKKGRERDDLYIIDVNQVKDDLASRVKLRWEDGHDEVQPSGFINFPTPSNGLYLFNNYFSHFEAEHRIIETKEGEGIAARWVKKNTTVQNHFFDCHIYNMALRDILVSMIGQDLKVKKMTWKEYVDILLGRATVKNGLVTY